MRINTFFILFATCACVITTASFATDSEEDILSKTLDTLKVGPSSPQAAEPKIITSYDKDKITTLAVGVHFLESQVHFFGGRGVYLGKSSDTITHEGRHLDFQEIKSGGARDIPLITLNKQNQIKYIFEDNDQDKPSFITTDKQKALLRQGRHVKSKMETDPQTTIYLDLHQPHSFPIDLIHLEGDIQKITRLPHGLRVNKLIIEYLGDQLYGGFRDFNQLDWSWLKNLSNLLTEDGQIFFEMRADETTRQDKKKLAPLSDELKRVKQCMQGMRIYKHMIADVLRDSHKTFPFVQKALTEAEVDLIVQHLNPTENLLQPQIEIEKILIAKFKENGFHKISSSFYRKHSNIPTRFYDTLVIEASPSNNFMLIKKA